MCPQAVGRSCVCRSPALTSLTPKGKSKEGLKFLHSGSTRGDPKGLLVDSVAEARGAGRGRANMNGKQIEIRLASCCMGGVLVSTSEVRSTY